MFGASLQALLNLPRRALVALVQFYRLFFSAWLGNRCRFQPSCSGYALQALEQHGAARGALLTASRLMRCHPLCTGGADPVPQTFKNPVAGLFTRLLQTAPKQSADTHSIRK